MRCAAQAFTRSVSVGWIVWRKKKTFQIGGNNKTCSSVSRAVLTPHRNHSIDAKTARRDNRQRGRILSNQQNNARHTGCIDEENQ